MKSKVRHRQNYAYVSIQCNHFLRFWKIKRVFLNANNIKLYKKEHAKLERYNYQLMAKLKPKGTEGRAPPVLCNMWMQCCHFLRFTKKVTWSHFQLQYVVLMPKGINIGSIVYPIIPAVISRVTDRLLFIVDRRV